MPTPEEIEQALQLAKLKKTQASARETVARAGKLERQVQRIDGSMLPIESATAQIASLAAMVRSALDRAPMHLPADLEPGNRKACELALDTTIAGAITALTDALASLKLQGIERIIACVLKGDEDGALAAIIDEIKARKK